MPPLNVPLLRSSFASIVEREPEVARHFYELLFTRYPSLKPVFRRTHMREQEGKLTRALANVLEHLESSEWLADHLIALGAKHVQYGVRDEMYDWVSECLVDALAGVAGADWTSELDDAWCDALEAVSDLMLTGASRYRTVARARAGGR
jgi:hemoglobin-like flavoprotein